MRARNLTLAAAIIWMAIGSLTGCASRQEVRYIVEPLPLPPRPVLPRLTADDLSCLSDDAYRRLVRRDMLRRQYAEELEAIIKSTRKGDQQ